MADTAPPIVRRVTFRAGAQRHSLAIGAVREVTRMPGITRLPHAPAALMGLANVRGTVIPVFSAAALLESGDNRPARLVVIEYDGPAGREWLGLAVDEASQVITADQDDTAGPLDVAALAARTLPAPAQRRAAGTSPAPLCALAGEVASTGLVVFALGNQEFALDVDVVETVLPRSADVALIPDADAVVIGSAAFGKGILAVLNLRALLALPASASVDRAHVMVVRITGERVGLQVDAVRGFLAVPDGLIDRVPRVLRRGAGGAHIRAICRLDGGERLIGVLAADQLLNADQTASMLACAEPECETITADVIADEGAATEQLLIFRIGADEFGIPVNAVETIAALPDTLTRLPGAPTFVEGVMNWRGTVVPVINAVQRLGAQSSTSARRRVIVVRIGEWPAGFVVDAICDVLRVDATALQPAPGLGNRKTIIFECVVNLTGARRIVTVISPRELLDRAEQDFLPGLGRQDSKAGP